MNFIWSYHQIGEKWSEKQPFLCLSWLSSFSPPPSSSLPLISDPTCTPFYRQGRVDAFHVQREEVLSWSTCTISPGGSTSGCCGAGARQMSRRWRRRICRRGRRILDWRSSTVWSIGWWLRFCTMGVAGMRPERRLGFGIRRWLMRSLCRFFRRWVSILMGIIWQIRIRSSIGNCRYLAVFAVV